MILFLSLSLYIYGSFRLISSYPPTNDRMEKTLKTRIKNVWKNMRKFILFFALGTLAVGGAKQSVPLCIRVGCRPHQKLNCKRKPTHRLIPQRCHFGFKGN